MVAKKEAHRSLFTIDLASDHVHSRFVSGAIWMIIPAMLAQLFVPGNMKFSELPSSDLRPASILIFNQPTVGAVVLGRELLSPLKALVTNKHGFPVADLELTAAIEDFLPSETFRWCQARERNGTLEAEALKDVCALQLAGSKATTNKDGVATFVELHLKQGFPGTMRLGISLDWCEDTGCGEREFELEQKVTHAA